MAKKVMDTKKVTKKLKATKTKIQEIKKEENLALTDVNEDSNDAPLVQIKENKEENTSVEVKKEEPKKKRSNFFATMKGIWKF